MSKNNIEVSAKTIDNVLSTAVEEFGSIQAQQASLNLDSIKISNAEAEALVAAVADSPEAKAALKKLATGYGFYTHSLEEEIEKGLRRKRIRLAAPQNGVMLEKIREIFNEHALSRRDAYRLASHSVASGNEEAILSQLRYYRKRKYIPVVDTYGKEVILSYR